MDKIEARAELIDNVKAAGDVGCEALVAALRRQDIHTTQGHEKQINKKPSEVSGISSPMLSLISSSSNSLAKRLDEHLLSFFYHKRLPHNLLFTCLLYSLATSVHWED